MAHNHLLSEDERRGAVNDCATDYEAATSTQTNGFSHNGNAGTEKQALLSSAEPSVSESGFGGKDISFLGGFALLLNNITGPGMVTIPLIFQQAGWLTPTLLMLICFVISSLAATMICKAMSLIPGNDHFQSRIEIEGLAKEYFPKWAYWTTLILLIVALQAVNISSIIISAQTMDFTLIAIFKYTCGIEIYPSPGFISETSKGEDISPFGNAILLSLGFAIVFVTTIPLGYFNLDDNIYVQILMMFLLLIIFLGLWMIDIFWVGLNFSRIPILASNQANVLGTIIFNYAFVVSIPSWVNEKKPGVSVNASIWTSNGMGTLLFLICGILAGAAFDYPGNDDLLDAFNNQSPKVLRVPIAISVYAFPFVVLLSGIPVYSIIVRYNLLRSGVCGKHWANFWAVIVP